ncbi:MAG: DUF1048 domain-containing protein [Clostridiales Family XIII bacterium]|jgi:DNA-binding ferritin-like protein (Dps family)|nr:DUF1048 domain-containing protein [Clostridiales Family XIII bacterium]
MNIFKKIIGVGEEKRIYRSYEARVKKLPREYQIVYREARKYIWNFSTDGLMDVLYDIVELFEQGAAEGKRVLDVTGDDVADFCDGLLSEWRSRTWTGNLRQKLNDKVEKELKKSK